MDQDQLDLIITTEQEAALDSSLRTRKRRVAELEELVAAEDRTIERLLAAADLRSEIEIDHLEEAKNAAAALPAAWGETRITDGDVGVIGTALEAIAHALIALVEQGNLKVKPDHSRCHHGNLHGRCMECPEPDLR